jgi:hypothetical protein
MNMLTGMVPVTGGRAEICGTLFELVWHRCNSLVVPLLHPLYMLVTPFVAPLLYPGHTACYTLVTLLFHSHYTLVTISLHMPSPTHLHTSGLNVQTQMSEVRKVLGVCPQVS